MQTNTSKIRDALAKWNIVRIETAGHLDDADESEVAYLTLKHASREPRTDNIGDGFRAVNVTTGSFVRTQFDASGNPVYNHPGVKVWLAGISRPQAGQWADMFEPVMSNLRAKVRFCCPGRHPFTCIWGVDEFPGDWEHFVIHKYDSMFVDDVSRKVLMQLESEAS